MKTLILCLFLAACTTPTLTGPRQPITDAEGQEIERVEWE